MLRGAPGGPMIPTSQLKLHNFVRADWTKEYCHRLRPADVAIEAKNLLSNGAEKDCWAHLNCLLAVGFDFSWRQGLAMMLVPDLSGDDDGK
jgi:hypothetical protein